MTSAQVRRARPGFEVVALTQHWRRIGGHWYRDAVVLVDGQRRLYALKDAA